MITALTANLANLSANDRSFAESLLAQYAAKGSLSEKQSAWVKILAERATGAQAAAPAAVAIGSVKGIVDLIGRAASRLKYPAILIATAGADTLRIQIAGEASKYHGDIMVTADAKGSDGRRPWIGRITKAGEFIPSKALSPAVVKIVSEALADFAAEPARVAAYYGKLTGKCCFCRLTLTDERSTSVGYGEICSTNWNLPYPSKASLQCVAA
jgi:hypothetical protein